MSNQSGIEDAVSPIGLVCDAQQDADTHYQQSEAVRMYKLQFVFLLFALTSAISHASGIERYPDAFGWPDKWDRVIAGSTEKYIGRLMSRLSGLADSDREKLEHRIRQGMNQWLGWQWQGQEVTESFVNACGTDLLDEMVDFYGGQKFTAQARRKIASEYEVCATEALERALSSIFPSFDDMQGSGSPEQRFNRMVASSVLMQKRALSSFMDKYLNARGHKAFAQSESGNWNWRSNRTSKEHAINNALASCRAKNKEHELRQPCRIVNVDNVWADYYRESVRYKRYDESVFASKKALTSYRGKYIGNTKNKAFAQSDNGAWSWRSSSVSKEDAKAKALAACRKNNKNHEDSFPCRIVNVNDQWIVY
jgi:hypothetical protein